MHRAAQAGSVTSAICASRWAITSSAATVAATPSAPAPREMVRPAIRSSTITGRAVTEPNGVIAALVTGHLPRSLGVRHRESIGSEHGPEFGPRDLPVAGHQDEQVVARPAPNDHRLDDRPGR